MPAAYHRSMPISDHQMRVHSASSESDSADGSTAVSFHSFMLFANPTARERRNGSVDTDRQSASIMSKSSVCACTMSVARERGTSLLSQSCSRALACCTSPAVLWPTASRAISNAVRTESGHCAISACWRVLVVARIGYKGWTEVRKSFSTPSSILGTCSPSPM